jgi:hypothetical protein
MNKTTVMAVLTGAAAIFLGNLAYQWYITRQSTGA